MSQDISSFENDTRYRGLRRLAAPVVVGGLLLTACMTGGGQDTIDKTKPYRTYTVQPGDKTIEDIVNRNMPEGTAFHDLAIEVEHTRAKELDISLAKAVIINQGDQLTVPDDFNENVSIEVIPLSGDSR